MNDNAREAKWMLILMLGVVSFVRAEPPVLGVPDGVSWQAVFDSGLRPKHVPGLETKATQCLEQEILLVILEHEAAFRLDSGLLSFEHMSNEGIRLMVHRSRVPITLEEAARRQEEFREMVREHLTQHGSVPVVMDPRRGSVMTGSENSVVARMGNYRLSYGFTASFQRERPVLPRFMYSWQPLEGEPRPPIRRHTVEPPEGYEWYSLDPREHTPDPGTEAESAAPGAQAARGGPAGRDRAAELLRAQEPGRFMRYLWLGVGAWLLAVAGGIALWLGWRHFVGRGRA